MKNPRNVRELELEFLFHAMRAAAIGFSPSIGEFAIKHLNVYKTKLS